MSLPRKTYFTMTVEQARDALSEYADTSNMGFDELIPLWNEWATKFERSMEERIRTLLA